MSLAFVCECAQIYVHGGVLLRVDRDFSTEPRNLGSASHCYSKASLASDRYLITGLFWRLWGADLRFYKKFCPIKMGNNSTNEYTRAQEDQNDLFAAIGKKVLGLSPSEAENPNKSEDDRVKVVDEIESYCVNCEENVRIIVHPQAGIFADSSRVPPDCYSHVFLTFEKSSCRRSTATIANSPIVRSSPLGRSRSRDLNTYLGSIALMISSAN